MDPEPAREAPVEIAGRKSSGFTSFQNLSRPGCGLVVGLVLIAWLIEIADQVFGFIGLPLEALGIRPRNIFGLVGVFLSPWLHGDWGHLINNSLSFLILGYVMILAEGKRFFWTTFLLMVISGLGTWLIGRGNSLHIGASGLIYGYFGYLLLRAWTERKPRWLIVGVLVAIFYGGMVLGVLPTQGDVSWEAHLCGFLGGLWLGRKHGLLGRAQSVLVP